MYKSLSNFVLNVVRSTYTNKARQIDGLQQAGGTTGLPIRQVNPDE